MEPWIITLIFLTISFVVGGAMLVGARFLGARAKTPSKLKELTYECGEEPEGSAWIKFHPRYYLVALIFVLFDVEAVFLIPWALNIRELGEIAIIDMFIFLGILMLGWLYALRKGALKWQ